MSIGGCTAGIYQMRGYPLSPCPTASPWGWPVGSPHRGCGKDRPARRPHEGPRPARRGSTGHLHVCLSAGLRPVTKEYRMSEKRRAKKGVDIEGGGVDAADIEVTAPPSDWSPEFDDGEDED